MKSHYRPVPEKRSPDKHASPWHKKVAEEGTILLSEVGSGLHGTSVSGYDDRDEMGVCIEPPDAVIGFKRFEQYEWKTAWEREGGRENRSGHGDTDLTVYSLRKWMRLAVNGNPSVLLPLFAPVTKLVKLHPLGMELREEMPQHILSSVAGKRFSGYLRVQRECMLSRDGKGRDVTRPELIEKYGFDTKFAGHMVRLGLQGMELMTTGRMQLPMYSSARQLIQDIRLGKHTMAECLDMAQELERQLTDIAEHPEKSPLPGQPNHEAVDRWLVSAYQRHWAGCWR